MDAIIDTDPETGATIVSHAFPDDTPVSVVIDCSPPSQDDVDALALLEEGISLVRAGDTPSGTEKIQAAQDRLTTSTNGRINVVPLAADDLAQREDDQQQAALAAAAADDQAATRAALTAKLASGKATETEVQSALAQLLGGTTS